MSTNLVVLSGNLIKDVELKYTPSEKAVASFAISVKRTTKGADGYYESDLLNITAWGKTAEFANQHLKKGSAIELKGRIQVRKYVANDGTNRTVTDIVAESVSFPVKDYGSANGNGHQDTAERVVTTPTPSNEAEDDGVDPFAD